MENLEQAKLENKLQVRSGQKPNIISHILCWWQIPTIIKCMKGNLKENDHWGLLEDHRSVILAEKLETAWKKEVEARKTPSLQKAIIKVFGSEFLKFAAVHLISELLCLIFQPFALRKILQYFLSEASKQEAYIYASIYSILGFIYVISQQRMHFEGITLGMKVRTACGSLIYRKALKLHKGYSSQTTDGQIINLLANDIKIFDLTFAYLPYIGIVPFQVIIVICITFLGYGYPVLIGLGIQLLAMLATYISSTKVKDYKRKAAKETDQRVRLIGGMLSGIQVIKLYTWEKLFIALVQKARKSEIRNITTSSHISIGTISAKTITNRLTMFAYFCAAILGNLPSSIIYVFPLGAMYEILRFGMAAAGPRAFLLLAECKAIIPRIEKFLLSDFNDHHVESTGEVGRIEFKRVEAKWVQSPENILDDVSFTVAPKELTAVVGTFGSGKSSLLQAILKEIPFSSGKLSLGGSISYGCQEPWIFASTIRQNILFSEDFDKAKYQKVIKICALEADFSLFPDGDRSLVGERGVMLSGGQKSRINLARAVYRDADIYILDDPLSAVDPRVAKHLFEECIIGYLRNKTVLLVTHQIHFLDKAGKIYVLDKGKITAEGTYNQLIEMRNEHFLKLVKKQNQLNESEEKNESLSEANTDAIQEKEDRSKKRRSGCRIYFIEEKRWIFTLVLVVLCIILHTVGILLDYFSVIWINLTGEDDQNQDTLFWQKWFTRGNFLYIYLVSVVIMIFLSEIRSWFLIRFCMYVAKILHEKMLRNVIYAKMEFLITHHSGDILTKFSKDIGTLDESLLIPLLDVWQFFFYALSIFILNSCLNYWLNIIMVVHMSLLSGLSYVFITINRNLSGMIGKYQSPVTTHLTTCLQGLPTIRASKAETLLIQEFDRHQDRYTSVYYTHMALTTAIRTWIDVTCTTYVTLATFSFFIVTGFPVSHIGLVIMESTALMKLISYITKCWGEVDTCLTSVERIAEYTEDITEKDDEIITPPKTWPPDGKIEFHSVSLRYAPSKPRVLHEIRFQVKPREKIGIVGRTGAGKSSLVSVLFNFFPFEGTVVIDGIDTKSLSLRNLRSKISIVTQDSVLFPETLRRNLDPFDQHSDARIWNALEDVRLKEVVSGLALGLQTVLSECTFSVGEKQLLCLVRAILRNTRIVVLDEATANIDFKSDELIQKVIKKWFRDSTVLVIAHRLATVMDCDKILVLDEGRVVEFDSPHRLLQDPEGFFRNYVLKGGKEALEGLTNMAEKYESSGRQ